MNKTIIKSFALRPDNHDRLTRMAGVMGCKPNHVLNLLIENASIQEVRKQEPVAVLPVAKNNRNAATKFEPQSSKAVGA